MHRVKQAIFAFGLTLAATCASALEIVPYSAEQFAKAQQAGEPIALHFHSDWCATCKQQTKAFNAMRSDPDLAMTMFVVGDDDRETLRRFRVGVTGVVVVFRGETERARSIGVVDPKQLRALLRSAFRD